MTFLKSTMKEISSSAAFFLLFVDVCVHVCVKAACCFVCFPHFKVSSFMLFEYVFNCL